MKKYCSIIYHLKYNTLLIAFYVWLLARRQLVFQMFGLNIYRSLDKLRLSQTNTVTAQVQVVQLNQQEAAYTPIHVCYETVLGTIQKLLLESRLKHWVF